MRDGQPLPLSLQHQQNRLAAPAKSAAACPSGSSAPCCKTDSTPLSTSSFLVHKTNTAPVRPHAPRVLLPIATHNPATANKAVPPPGRDVHGLRMTRQPQHPSNNNRLPAIQQERCSTTASSSSARQSASDRPKCGCGCDCDTRVTLLVRKVEEILGLPKNSSPVLSAHMDGMSDSQWVDQILSPMVGAFGMPSLPSFPSLPSTATVTTTTSAPITAIRPMSGMTCVAPMQVPQPISSTSSVSPIRKLSGTTSEPQALPRLPSFLLESQPESMGSLSRSTGEIKRVPTAGIHKTVDNNNSSGRSTLGFASGVIAPVVPMQSSIDGCCLKKRPAGDAMGQSLTRIVSNESAIPGVSGSCCSEAIVSPQQVLPVNSCCDKTPAAAYPPLPSLPSLKRFSSGAPIVGAAPRKLSQSGQHQRQRAAASGCGNNCSCSCSKNRKWMPGSKDRPQVDADGALACSCGCHKPFSECADCLEDLCDNMLLKSSI
ncbi:hypothetical protein BX070DRAFT_51476 [Coemansia spiralis]|nr:hypothetical protein BX070DRAFT_51476 [Coemansia spiralis]